MTNELSRLGADFVHRPDGWGDTPQGNMQAHSIYELKCMITEIDAMITDLAGLEPSQDDIDRIDLSKLLGETK